MTEPTGPAQRPIRDSFRQVPAEHAAFQFINTHDFRSTGTATTPRRRRSAKFAKLRRHVRELMVRVSDAWAVLRGDKWAITDDEYDELSDR